MTLDELLEAPAPQLAKADAILAYVDAMDGVWGMNFGDRQTYLDAAADWLDVEATSLGDPDLAELTVLGFKLKPTAEQF